MRSAARILLWTLGVLLGLPVLLATLVLVGANTQPGRDFIARAVPRLTDGQIAIEGLAGRFPDALRTTRVEVRDTQGSWLVVDDLAFDWSPTRLLTGEALIDRLAAGRVTVSRPPAIPTPATPEAPGTSPSLPLAVTLRSLEVARLELAPSFSGTAAAVSIEGQARLASLEQGEAALSVRRLDGAGHYSVDARFDPTALQARLKAEEPPNGLVASLAGLPDLGAIALDASAEGPRSAVKTTLSLAAGALRASARGTLDLVDGAADLTVTASAPAMTPRPDLSWQSVSLDATVSGPFTKPTARATLRIDGIRAAGAELRQIAADVRGDAGALRVRAKLDGLRVPGPHPDLLAAAPLVLDAEARLDQPERPVTFSLEHPLLAAQGRAETAGEVRAAVTLTVPALAPLAAAGGVDVQGRTALELRATVGGDATTVDVDGTVSITGGATPLPGLVGDAARLGLSAALRGRDVTLSRLQFDGKAVRLSAAGGVTSDVMNLNWRVAVSKLAALAPTVTGTLQAEGRVTGPLDDLAVTADLNGEVGTTGMPRGPLTAHLDAKGLPAAPSGRITARGTLDGSPLELALAVARSADGAVRVAIDRADWKSGHAQGTLTLAQGASVPVGTVDLRMTRLEDLRALTGEPLTGAVTATVETTQRDRRTEARVTVEARNAGLAGSASVERATLTATVLDPTARPVVDGRLVVEGFSAGGVAGSGQLEAKGPAGALALRLSAELGDLAGAPLQATGAAILDARAKSMAVSALQARWKGETLRLLAPARIAFAAGVAVDRLRLGVREATLEVAGRVSPSLDLTAALRNVSPDLASPFVPELKADGTLRADAKLSGTAAHPTGTVRVEATGLRMREGPGRSLPPANLTATASLAGETARLDSRLTAGRATTLSLTGEAPLGAGGRLDLRADGSVDLALLDPLLTAAGRHARGQVTLNLGVAGTPAQPRLTGNVQLARGEVQDFAEGLRVSDISALVQLEGDSVRIARFSGRAGPGTITVSGTIGVLVPGVPIELSVQARDARPLASDRVSVSLNTDLTLTGQATDQLLLAGSVYIHRAEIRIPEHLPAGVARLEVRRPGQKPPPPRSPGPAVALDLTVEAPRAIFVRGRGLDAELGGTVRVQGTTAEPQPLGSFEMRRGQVSFGGQTLTFTRGEVGFDGGSLTDPSLDFTASTTHGNVTASLNVGGTVSNPKITFSSTPELPQDEVLAELLFARSASALSPFELAQIASAIAQLTGVTSGGGDPLGSIRQGLGLDRLSVGSSPGGDPTLEAGRYVAPGVYVGARQGISTSTTQAVVQVDLTKGLKLEGAVGTSASSATGTSGAGGSSIGVIYQFEY